MNYNQFKSRNLMSEAVASIFFGQNEECMESLEYADSYPSLSYNIGLFYVSLVQAFTFARLLKGGTTINQANYPMRARDAIRNIWPRDEQSIGKVTSSIDKLEVFSFLSFAKELGKNVFDGPEDIIQKIATARQGENGSQNYFNIVEKLFVTFIESLPLLKNTDVDFEHMRFIFNYTDESGSNATAEIDCRPFLFFRNNEKDNWVKEYTPNCYVMTSVSQGERSGELLISLRRLNELNATPEPCQIRWQASKNETVRMIFQSLEIPGDWLSIDEYWCDFAFMQKLANAFEEALAPFWGLRGNQRNSDIRGELNELFADEDIRSSISNQHWHNNKIILLENIDKIFFGLFINHGSFRTVRSVFYTRDDDESESNRRSALFKDVLVNLLGSAEAASPCISECEKEIDAHIKVLKKKIPYESSNLYKNRRREIIAEWRAFTILKAAGIQSDNLFIDKEVMYSIDDYYLMVKSTETPLEDDLKRVMRLLIELYEPLTDARCLDKNDAFNEPFYYDQLWKVKDEIKNLDLSVLFERFGEVIERSENCPAILTLLGRKAICNKVTYKDYAGDILDLLKKDHKTKPSSYLTDRYIFISYAHKDDEHDDKDTLASKEKDLHRISQFVEKWTEMGYQVFFDKKDFHGGNDWAQRAKNAIKNRQCAGVVVFMSRNAAISKPVAKELKWAEEEAKSRYGQNEYDKVTEFIVPVNLDEPSPIDEYLEKLEVGNSEQSKNASDIREVIQKSKLYRKYSEFEKLTEDIDRLLLHTEEVQSQVCKNEYNDLELQIVNFYAFLKFGDDAKWKRKETIDDYIRGENERGKNKDATGDYICGNDDTLVSMARCIYPIVASMRETKIRRDNITMVAYETASPKHDATKREANYILTSKPLTNPDDYYCIPHYGRVSDDCTWMIDPLLISFKKMTER